MHPLPLLWWARLPSSIPELLSMPRRLNQRTYGSRPEYIYYSANIVQSKRKSIYDDEPTAPASTGAESSSLVAATRQAQTSRKSPTDRLAVQIGKTRLFIHAHVAAAEDKVNSAMNSLLTLENNFTSTVASLAPSRESGERIMPGAVYVLVAAMAGSIATRNRSILLRGSAPLAIVVAAGWVVLPVTMRNVSDLLWKYEQKFPALANGHLKAKSGIERAIYMTRVHTEQAVRVVDEKVGEGREAVEGWVSKGK